MQIATFRREIRDRYDELQELIRQFNGWWPQHMRGGEGWRLPVQGRDQCFVPGGGGSWTWCEGAQLAEEAGRAIAQLELCSTGQNPVTAMRMPGWVALDQPVVAPVARINEARAAIAARVDAEIAAMNLAASTAANMRGKLLRSVIPGISLRHLFRKLHAFDTPPLSIQFHWAGAGASYTRVTAAAERERLAGLVAAEARSRHIDAEATGHQRELERLAPFRDDARLVVVRPLTPHPRVMLFFSSRSRYEAMPHANLPLFIHCPSGSELPHVRPLPPVTEAGQGGRRGQRGRTQMALISDHNPRRLIYLWQPERKGARQSRLPDAIRSTYGEG